MKTLKLLYNVLAVLCLIYGFPVAVMQAGKEGFVTALVIGIVGVVLLLIEALFIMYWRTKHPKQEPNDQSGNGTYR